MIEQYNNLNTKNSIFHVQEACESCFRVLASHIDTMQSQQCHIRLHRKILRNGN